MNVLKTTIGIGVASCISSLPASNNTIVSDCQTSRPNILLIQCDQLAAKATSLGNDNFADMPNMDRLFAQSVRFTRAYTVCPLCSPARAAIWTGRYPHETRVVSNVDPELKVPFVTIGETFSNAGYQTAHFGKKHDAGTLRGFQINPSNQQIKFEDKYPVNYDSFEDKFAVKEIVKYFATTKGQTQPFFAIADLNNPHNICQFIGENMSRELPPEDTLPPLPKNFEISDWETRPLPVQFIYRTHPRKHQTKDWTKAHYRYYLHAYAYYINKVDKQVGEILQALKESGHADNTIVILTSDHGEGMAELGTVSKHLAFYESSTNIPMVIYDPRNKDNTINRDRIVSNLDLYPTLCDYAKIDNPAGLRGTSLLSETYPNYAVSEWVSEYFNTVSPGRMLVTKEYKYVHFREGNGEELYNLVTDPGETKNLAPLKEHHATLEKHRAMLSSHIKATNDNYYSQPVIVDPRYRTHLTPANNILGSDAITEGRTIYQGRSEKNLKTFLDSYK